MNEHLPATGRRDDASRRRAPLPVSYPAGRDPLDKLEGIEDPERRARLAPRLRRIRRWRRPLERRRDRLRAWLNMLFVDHGAFRLIYPNMWRVTPRLWRSAQPLPHQLRRFARAGGRTVVSLRGGQSFGSLPLEIEACAAAGLGFHTIVLHSRGLPGRDELIAVLDAFAALETPVLVHCKSGADRAGFAAALWLLAVEGAGLDAARAQLSLRFGHVRQSRTGVLDAVFAAYAADGGPAALAFRDWVATRYDPQAIAAGFRPATLGTLIGDRLLARE